VRGLWPIRRLVTLGSIHVCKDERQAIKRTADNLRVVRTVEVLDQGTLRGQAFKVLGQIFPSTAPPLPAFHCVEEALGEIVRSVNKTSAASGRGGQVNLVTPEGFAVFLEVLEDDVDGLAKIACGSSLRAALVQGRDEAPERGAHVA
jgi:hypothetical protein